MMLKEYYIKEKNLEFVIKTKWDSETVYWFYDILNDFVIAIIGIDDYYLYKITKNIEFKMYNYITFNCDSAESIDSMLKKYSDVDVFHFTGDLHTDTIRKSIFSTKRKIIIKNILNND